MEPSILTSTKKVLGLEPTFTEFDQDVMMHINSAFSTLEQLGVGPVGGYMIEDASAEWVDFVQDLRQQNMARNYVFLQCRLFFDAQNLNGYMVTAMKEQIQQLEWRMNVRREDAEWVDPDPQPVVVEDE